MKITHLIGLFSLGLAASALAGGCSSSTDTTGVGGGGGNTSSSSTSSSGTTTTPSSTSSGTSTSTTPDESTSCADAVTLAEQSNSLGGKFYDATAYLNPAGDSDYFKFDANAGDWIQLSTDANPDDDPAMVDTVVTLYDETGQTQLAEADDQTPRITTDSELFYHVESAGTFCVRVMEFSEWNGDTPEGDPSYEYRMIMVPMDFALYDFVNEDTEPNDSVGAAQSGLSMNVDSQTGQEFTQLAGLLDSSSDVDVYQVTAPTGALGLGVNFTPSGTDGYGSTKGPGVVNLYDSDGTTILAQLDYQKGSDGLSSVPITAGNTYYVEVSRPDANVGANDFYFLKYGSQDQLNSQESDDTANNASTGADVDPNPQVNAQTGVTSYFIGGTIPAGDTDWWKFDNLTPGQTVAVVCSSQRAGAGVANFTVEWYADPQGTAVQSETETDSADILWSDAAPDASNPSVSISAGGTQYVKLSSTTDLPNVTSKHYLCGVHVINP